MPILPSSFQPALGLSNPHLQTSLPMLNWRIRGAGKRYLQQLHQTTEELELPDGDSIELHHFSSKTQPPSGHTRIFLHGLEGDLNSHYPLPIIAGLCQQGDRVCFMYFRGCSGTPNRLARSYHSGDTQDLRWLIEHLESKHPKLSAIGVSLGANVLLKYLGEQKNDSRLQTALAISPPFDLQNSAQTLDKPSRAPYRRYLLHSLKAGVIRKFSTRSDSPIPLEQVQAIEGIEEFDQRITAPLHGFTSAQDYYHQSSCGQYLAKITTPTTILHAKDDPFMSPSAIPKEQQLAAPVQLLLSDHGGHVGFIGRERDWLAKQSVQRLALSP